MFGAFRFVLAAMVVVTHMFYPYWFGHYAVFGFFVLSGYLMVLVTNRTYPLTTAGVSKFLVNRFLRIYPIYIVILLISLLVVYYTPNSQVFNEALKLPDTASDWVRNVFIFGMAYDSGSRIIPPVWALANELVFYLLICLFLGRNAYVAMVWFLASILWVASSIYSEGGFSERYFSIAAASLPFSVGALIYHYKKYLDNIFDRVPWWFLVLFTIYVFISPICILFLEKGGALFNLIDPHGLVMYLNIILMAIWIGKLNNFKFKDSRLVEADKFLGDLSYPIYLVHWIVGLLVANYILDDLNRGSFLLMLICLLCSIIFSSFLVVYVERPLESIRSRVRRYNAR